MIEEEAAFWGWGGWEVEEGIGPRRKEGRKSKSSSKDREQLMRSDEMTRGGSGEGICGCMCL